ncbi:MAG: hypothetical protein ACM3X7_07205 [Solirubrobacterales bacterium]
MKKNIVGVLLTIIITAAVSFFGGYSYYPYKNVSNEKLYIFINPDKDTVKPGSVFTYNYIVFNAGDVDLTAVSAKDSAGGLTWNIGTLKAGKYAYITKAYSVDENPKNEYIENKLTVKCDQVPQKSATDKTPITK